MKLNNKGWGTTEMLLLSGGLLVALIVAIFFISKFYGSLTNSISNRQYVDLENSLENAAKNYIRDNDIDILDEYTITYQTLKESNYIKYLNDNNGNECSGYVKISRLNNVTYYNGYISCENYQTRNY